MSKISVIIPVHNAEKFLSKAIESVLNQTYTDFELLLIDDMSTDNSKAICREYVERDNRIVLLENNSKIHGPGPTRNIGLDYATGEYIYFMDADDWADSNLLQCAVNRMKETNADIVQFGAFYERNNGSDPDRYYWSGKTILTKNEIKEDFYHYWKENRNSLWMHLFRRKAVEKIRFDNIVIGEDISYVMDALGNAEKIAYLAEPLYHYRYIEGSTSHRWVENTIECRRVIWEHQKNFLESLKGDIDKVIYAEVAYDNYIWAIYQLSSNWCSLSYRDKKRKLLELKENMEFDKYRDIYPLRLQHGIQKMKHMLVKYHLEGILLFFGPAFLRIARGE